MSSIVQALGVDGYALVPGLLSTDWIQALKSEEQRFAVARHSLSVQVQLVNKSAVIRDFVTNGPQIDLAVQVLGQNVCFTHQQYVSKRGGESGHTDVPWHQDNGYGRLEPPDDLTIWITLDDCDELNGCLWVVPESQQRGLLPHSMKHGLMVAEVEEEGIPLPMKAGDAVVFNSLLLHRSLPNRTEHTRVAMYARYCTPHVTMVTDGNKPVLEDAYSWMVAGEAP